MQCTNCGFELPDNLSFCTNCGAAVPVGLGADQGGPGASEKADLDSLLNVVPSDDQAAPSSSGLGASLEAALQANQDQMDSIEARAQAQVDAAFGDYSSASASAPASSMGYDYDQGMGGWTDETNQAGAAQGAGAQPNVAAAAGMAGAAAAGAAFGAGAAPYAAPNAAPYAGAPQQAQTPFYQQDVSPNAHYSSQRSYDTNAYGQNVGQQPNPAGYQPPSYGQPAPQPNPYSGAYSQPPYGQPAPQPENWGMQTNTTTARAFAMVLYVSSLIGVIIALCVRDKSDPFITHHLNNVVVILIGVFIGWLLTVVLIGLVLLVYLLVMTIMGMINAYNGEMKELPLIGKIHIIK